MKPVDKQPMTPERLSEIESEIENAVMSGHGVDYKTVWVLISEIKLLWCKIDAWSARNEDDQS